jgi:hypothetical protein
VPKKKTTSKSKTVKSSPDLSLVKALKRSNMSYVRVGLVLFTFLIVGSVALAVSYYARGYRFDSTSGEIEPNGILVLKSVPDSAQIFINGELKTATDSTLPLSPNTYDVTLKKEGFMEWSKRLTITKEVVTEATAYLFRAAPSLSSLTFSGITNLIPNSDLTKIAYVVPPSLDSLDQDVSGLWVMEILNLPLGFSREPRRITDGDLTNATWTWSPDGADLLLTTKTGVFLLDTSTFTAQAQRVNISTTKDQLLSDWEEINKTKLEEQLSLLPPEMSDILRRKASAVVFAPDEKMVLYTASSSANISEELIPPLPGSSTQKEQRGIKEHQTYIYDIEEDRNFLVDESSSDLAIDDSLQEFKRRMSWFPTSRHLVLAEENKIVIMDYDGTNRKTVYSGSYISPHAYPSLSSDRLLILTNLGAIGTLPNLYSLSLR